MHLLFPGDPATGAITGGDLAVQTRGDLQRDKRPTARDGDAPSGIQLLCLRFEHPGLDIDTSGS
jgi:hypothetical protein